MLKGDPHQQLRSSDLGIYPTRRTLGLYGLIRCDLYKATINILITVCVCVCVGGGGVSQSFHYILLKLKCRICILYITLIVTFV